VLPGVADATVHLHVLQRHALISGQGVSDSHRGREIGLRACRPCGVPRRRDGELGVDEHVRAVVLDRLERADGPAELLTRCGVAGGQLGACAEPPTASAAREAAAAARPRGRAPTNTSATGASRQLEHGDRPHQLIHRFGTGGADRIARLDEHYILAHRKQEEVCAQLAESRDGSRSHGRIRQPGITFRADAATASPETSRAAIADAVRRSPPRRSPRTPRRWEGTARRRRRARAARATMVSSGTP